MSVLLEAQPEQRSGGLNPCSEEMGAIRSVEVGELQDLWVRRTPLTPRFKDSTSLCVKTTWTPFSLLSHDHLPDVAKFDMYP